MELEDLTADDIQALIDLGIIPEEQEELLRQRATAESIRGQRGPGMRYAGEVPVAASPLEFAGDFLQKFTAQQDIKDQQAAQAALLRQQTEARRKFFEAISRGEGFNSGGGGGGGAFGGGM